VAQRYDPEFQPIKGKPPNQPEKTKKEILEEMRKTMSTLVYRCRQIITDGTLIGEFSVDGFVEKSVEGKGDGGYRGAPGQYSPG